MTRPLLILSLTRSDREDQNANASRNFRSIHGPFYNPINVSFATGSNFPPTFCKNRITGEMHQKRHPENALPCRSSQSAPRSCGLPVMVTLVRMLSVSFLRQLPVLEITDLPGPKTLRGEPKPLLDEVRELINAKEKISYIRIRPFERLFRDLY